MLDHYAFRACMAEQFGPPSSNRRLLKQHSGLTQSDQMVVSPKGWSESNERIASQPVQP